MAYQILLAEDDATLMLAHLTYLKGLGDDYAFLEAADGNEALRLAQEKLPDLILADWVMPGLSGLELIKALKENPQTNDIPIIMISAMIAPSDLEKAFEIGAVDYLRKPVERVELQARVKGALRTYSYIKKIQHQQIELAQTYDQLTELNAIKDVFFTIISGDLNEPLNSLTAFVNLLIKSINNFSKEEMKFIAENIRSSLHSISSLLKNLIEWTRSESDPIGRPQHVELKPLLESALLYTDNGFTRKSVRIDINLLGNETVWIQKDVLAAILQVVAESSARFIAKNGELSVSLSPAQEGFVICNFQYTGFKITKEQFQNLLHLPYYHTNEITYFEKGSGLGFVIGQKMLEKCNGNLTARSIGKDLVVFEMLLPIAEN
jgi:two-component system, sensor histidine kinase and response regulator